MKKVKCEFEHDYKNISDIKSVLNEIGATMAVLKMLPKNANDKNQVYIASDLNILHPTFALTFQERGQSESITKRQSDPNKVIPEAVFDNFYWLTKDKKQVQAKGVKAILYAQYPEARLSGFQTIENSMPRSMSVEYTKQTDAPKRLLILAQLPGGTAVGLMLVAPSESLTTEVSELPSFNGSRVCKKLIIEQDGSTKLATILKDIIGKTFDGCRYDKHGNTIPFRGTQVCGYTLEHACEIIPNSNKNGDIFGIELKTHTQKKVTLFTPEPDFGDYRDDYPLFMKTNGYKDAQGNWRLTGVHKAGILSKKSGLTLKVRAKKYVKSSKLWIETDYDPDSCSTAKMDYMDVVLLNSENHVTAGWSFERLMNCWGAKHNEVVYIPASKKENSNKVKHKEGFEFEVTFGQTVMWCKNTTADQLFKAIHEGIIFLDPAPKLHASDPSQNKRRSQWRVNDIAKAATTLYTEVLFRELTTET
jgi:hypothetical protein